MRYLYLQRKDGLLGRTLLQFCLIFLQLCTLSFGHPTDEAEPRCGIYLAPSTIPMAGLGVYAGDVNYEEDDVVAFGDLAIPVVDYEWNNQGGPYQDDFFLWNEYGWSSSTFPGMDDESHGPDTIMGVSPGVGAMPNFYSSMTNIEDQEVTVIGRVVDANSPGIGANTIYYERVFHAITDIPPGQELFLDYGLDYFRDRTAVYGYIPDVYSFVSTDLILRIYLGIRKKALSRWRFHNVTTSQTSSSKGRVDNGFMITDVQDELWKDLYKMMKDMRSVWPTSRILNGLPEDVGQLEHIMANGGSSQQHYNRSIREISWLEENGQCMDNIRNGKSNIPDAGEGAFANRFIPKGGLVVPAPLIHIQDYNSLKMFQPKYDMDHPNQFAPDRDGPFTFQLLLNYCFGHEKSTLLLCPYGPFSSFINHSRDNPNTRIQWNEQMRHPGWRDKPINEWGGAHYSGLRFDFVALRDIEKDEEILLDYGSAWESAWHKHVKRFVPREGYVPAFELNKMPDLELRGEDEADYEAHGVFLMCHGWYIREFAKKVNDSHCRILKKLDNNRYVAQLLKVDLFGNEDGRTTIEEGAVLLSVPREALFFKDMPHSRDHYQPNAFRHAMMIPDDMFPEAWKNK